MMPQDARVLAEVDGAARLAVAALIGLAVGLEREWSGHASGPTARFAGIRTSFLLGVLGGISGLFAAQGYVVLGAAGAAAGMAIAVAAYVAATRAPQLDPDSTTEVAAIVVVALAALAGTGWLTTAAAAGAIVVLALREKERLHRLVASIGRPELSAALQFAVLAVVILPILPRGPYLGIFSVRPRALWGVVLAFCGLNFASYIAQRLVGTRRGYVVAGALGGLLSSTAVALSYARRSRAAGEDAGSLARGVIAACTVLIPRIFAITTVLNPRVAMAAIPFLLPSLIGGILIVTGAAPWHRPHAREESASTGNALPGLDERNPLRLASAIRMAAALQLALSGIAILTPRLGETGLYGLAVTLGLTDMDALSVSMSRSPIIAAGVAGRALGVGMLANTLFKLALSLLVGTRAFRRRASLGLGVLGALSAAALVAL